MTEKNSKLLVYSQGTMGDALMFLCVFAEMLNQAPGWEFIVYTSSNQELLSQIYSGYSQVQVRKAPILSSLFESGNKLIVFPPTFGFRTSRLKLIAKIIGLNPHNKVVSFPDRNGKYLSKNHANFDINKIFLKNLENIFEYTGHERMQTPIKPQLPSDSNYRRRKIKNRYVLVHPFAANPARSLPKERWREILRFIFMTYPDRTIVVTGISADMDEAKLIIAGFKERVVLALGQKFSTLVDLVNNSDLYIGVDTGVTHLAGLLQKKTVLIGNLSNPTWLPTYNKNATILYNESNCTCRGNKSGDCFVEVDGQNYYRCMYEIDNEHIQMSIKEMLSK